MHDPALLVTAPLPDGQSPTRHEITIGQGPASPPIALVGTQFCTPYFLDFSVEKKLSAKRYAITDRDGKAAFQVKGRKFTLRHKRRLFNDHGKVILTLKRKIRSKHQRWRVYKKKTKKVLFTVKRASAKHGTTKLNVFSSKNKDEKVCDFKIEWSGSEQSCHIYHGKSTTVVAQIKKHKENEEVTEEKFVATVYPNIDHAFVIAIFIILEDTLREHVDANGTEDEEKESDSEDEEDSESGDEEDDDDDSSEKYVVV